MSCHIRHSFIHVSKACKSKYIPWSIHRRKQFFYFGLRTNAENESRNSLLLKWLNGILQGRSTFRRETIDTSWRVHIYFSLPASLLDFVPHHASRQIYVGPHSSLGDTFTGETSSVKFREQRPPERNAQPKVTFILETLLCSAVC